MRGADGDDLPQNFLARLLCKGFDRVLRRGLGRGYREHSEETRRPRGKMDLPVIARRALRVPGPGYAYDTRNSAAMSSTTVSSRRLCGASRASRNWTSV